MRCSYYCTADLYNLDLLSTIVKNVKLYDSVAHLKPDEDSDVFVFTYGAVVFWNSTPEKLALMQKICDQIAINPLAVSTADGCQFEYGEKTEIEEEHDLIFLDSNDALIKLSLSHALSQSAKLEVFEKSIANTIQGTRSLSQQIRSFGKTSLSRKKVSQLMGALFQERNFINLDFDLLDTPEFFWKRPRYEPYYQMTVDYLDLRPRLSILNRRLDVVHELYIFLSNELNNAHSSFLEWIIIVLISVEIFIEVFKHLHASL